MNIRRRPHARLGPPILDRRPRWTGRDARFRRAGFEPLECRRLLAASQPVVGNTAFQEPAQGLAADLWYGPLFAPTEALSTDSSTAAQPTLADRMSRSLGPNDPDDVLSGAIPLQFHTSGDLPRFAIDEPGDVDFFSISCIATTTAVANTLTKHESNPEIDLYFKLFDRFGNVIAENDDDPDPYLPYVNPLDPSLEFYYPEDDTYYLAVSAYPNINYNPFTGQGVTDSATGTYQLGLYFESINPPDSNDQISEAVLLDVYNQTQPMLTVDGTVDFQGDVDMYWLYAGDDRTWRFEVASIPGQLVHTNLGIYTATGERIARSSYDLGSGSNPYLEITLPEPGNYYLGVSADENASYDPVSGDGDAFDGFFGIGPYTLKVSLVDQNLTIGQATPLGFGAPFLGVINYQTDVDFYSISVLAGQKVGFDVDQAIFSDVDAYLRLFDAFGNPLAVNDDGNNLGPPTEVDNLDPYLEYRFAHGGTYYVGISAYPNHSYNPLNGSGRVGHATAGYYTLTLFNFGRELPLGDANGDGEVGAADYTIWAAQFGQVGVGLAGDIDLNGEVGAGDYVLWAANFGNQLAPAASADVVVTAVDPDGLLLGATPLPFSLFIDHADSIEPSGDVDFYAITGGATQRVALRALGGDLDLAFRLFDEFGNLIAENDDYDGLNPYLEVYFPLEQTVYLGVSAFPNTQYDPLHSLDRIGSPIGGYWVGAFDLGFNPPDVNDQLAEAQILDIYSQRAAVAPGAIDFDGDVDLYAVYVNEDRVLQFDVDGGGARTYLRIFDAGGNPVLTSAYNPATGSDPFLEIVFPGSGYYYAGVSGLGNTVYRAIEGDQDQPGDLGGYSLRVRIVDQNATLGSARQLPGFGSAVPEAIDFQADVDMFAFTVLSGQRLAFDVDQAIFSDVDAYLRIFDAAGNELAHNDDGFNQGPPSEVDPLDPYLEYRFAHSGTYYVGISAYPNTLYNAIDGSNASFHATYGYYFLTVFDLGREFPIGDATQDGLVGAGDYAVWAAQFGRVGPGLAADFDRNGEVGLADYALWVANFGEQLAAAPPNPAAVSAADTADGSAALLEPAESQPAPMASSASRGGIGRVPAALAASVDHLMASLARARVSLADLDPSSDRSRRLTRR